VRNELLGQPPDRSRASPRLDLGLRELEEFCDCLVLRPEDVRRVHRRMSSFLVH
jgi:hypothetical protein